MQSFFLKVFVCFSFKNKSGVSIINTFQKIISKGRKPSKIWTDQGGEFYNNLFKRFSKISNIEMYSKYNQGKAVVAERFIRTLKKKIFKHMTAILKNVYFDVLYDIVDKYNNSVHKTIKIKPIGVTSDSYAKNNGDCNETKPKFRVGDHFRISKYKKTFLLMDTLKIGQKKLFSLPKLRIQFRGLLLLVT